MKRSICGILALALVLSLLAGCSGSGSPTQPTAEARPTEPSQTAPTEPIDPPRKVEDIVPRLNAALKAQGIPVEFVYQGEYATQLRQWDGQWVEGFYSLYQACVSESGAPQTTVNLDCSVEYRTSQDEAAHKLQIWVADEATDRERELHRAICQVAALLCDEHMTPALTEQMFNTQPESTEYILYRGDVGSYTAQDYWAENAGGDFIRDTQGAVCQPHDLTHTLEKRLASREEWYEIHFTGEADRILADRELDAPTLEQVEQRLNAALEQMDLPISCRILPYGSNGSWEAVFQYTTLDDPDFPYPEFPYDVYGKDIEKKFVESWIRAQMNYVYLTLYTTDPERKDTPVCTISLSGYEPVLPQLPLALMQACDPENGAQDLALLREQPVDVTTNWQRRFLEKENVIFSEEVPMTEDDGSGFWIQYTKAILWGHSYSVQPEKLLEPERLQYDFRTETPLVLDGKYNFYQSYETNFCGYNGDFVEIDMLLSDYLLCTRAGLSVDYSYYINSMGGYVAYYAIHAADYAGDPSTELDRGAFYISDVSYDGSNRFRELYMYYDPNVEQYLTDGMNDITTENLLLVPIGLTLLMDEELTAEAALRMHTEPGEYDFISSERDKYILPEGYQVTVHATGQLIHLVAEDPATGMRWYNIIGRRFAEQDADYRHLLDYIEN